MALRRLSLSTYVLLAANLVPLIGVVFFEWNTVLVLALFWIENLVIGVFNVIKIVIVSFVNKDTSGLFLSIFFVVHYGIFCSAHGTLLSDLLNYPVLSPSQLFGVASSGIADLFLSAASVLVSFINGLSPMILLGIAALSMSHLISFIENFILRGELFKLSARELMMKPYQQIFVMHIGLILGALVLDKFGSPVWMLGTIVLAKTVVDVSQFNQRHNTESRLLERTKGF